MYFPGEDSWTVVVKKKVCLVGEGAVGKTSLIRRFVSDSFDDAYITTVGTKVTKKEVVVKDPRGIMTKVDMTVWDIMGQPGFRELLKQAYFYGAGGVVAVCDLSRKETYDALDPWIEDVRNIIGEEPPVIFFGNKDDIDEKQVTKEDMDVVAKRHNSVSYMTSAKTGNGVEDGFATLAQEMLKINGDSEE